MWSLEEMLLGGRRSMINKLLNGNHESNCMMSDSGVEHHG
jgi:hypothetical protein